MLTAGPKVRSIFSQRKGTYASAMGKEEELCEGLMTNRIATKYLGNFGHLSAHSQLRCDRRPT